MRAAPNMEEVYRRREQLHPAGYYSLFQPGQNYSIQRREEDLLRLLCGHGISTLAGLRILDLGCGGGDWILRFQLYGSRPVDLVGIEIQAERARNARVRTAASLILQADAGALPFADGRFDLVHQSTLLTLVLDPAARRRIAIEMLRVLRPGGVVLWYDFRYSNPRNPDARGIGRREIKDLFPGCRVTLRPVTLAPFLARRLASRTWLGCRVLEWARPLRTHYLGLIQAPGGRPSRRGPVAPPAAAGPA